MTYFLLLSEFENRFNLIIGVININFYRIIIVLHIKHRVLKCTYVLGTSLNKNTACLGRDVGIRNISKGHEDLFENNKSKTIE